MTVACMHLSWVARVRQLIKHLPTYLSFQSERDWQDPNQLKFCLFSANYGSLFTAFTLRKSEEKLKKLSYFCIFKLIRNHRKRSDDALKWLKMTARTFFHPSNQPQVPSTCSKWCTPRFLGPTVCFVKSPNASTKIAKVIVRAHNRSGAWHDCCVHALLMGCSCTKISQTSSHTPFFSNWTRITRS